MGNFSVSLHWSAQIASLLAVLSYESPITAVLTPRCTFTLLFIHTAPYEISKNCPFSLHRRFLSRNLMQVLSRYKLQLQYCAYKPAAISARFCRRGIARALNLFETCCNSSSTKIALSCAINIACVSPPFPIYLFLLTFEVSSKRQRWARMS